MDHIYLIIVIALFVLAISDLIVGVSNDAVNFLNSAVGSKAARFKTIMIIAAAGILAGTLFSNGMMDVARKGVFYPGQFTFHEIMLIFTAVMLTDIILLDTFNTLGLPTSTTVSIVFELLGAATAVTIIKLNHDADPLTWDKYINAASALKIISGILLSVIVSFTVGALIQWLVRVIFSFDYKLKMKRYGAIFGGIAIATISFFILIKGIKSTPFAKNTVTYEKTVISDDFAKFHKTFEFTAESKEQLRIANVPPSVISSLTTENKGYKFETDKDKKLLSKQAKFENDVIERIGSENFALYKSPIYESLQSPLILKYFTQKYAWQIVGVFFLFWLITLQLLMLIFRINVLKVIVLIGTFALAMAFAGNDLVNFVGVPIAGFISFLEFKSVGNATFNMDVLNNVVQSPTYMLIISGLVMVGTLWFSKKAKRVIKTSLDLSRQDTGSERFGSSHFSRSLVRGSVGIGNFLAKITPERTKKNIQNRFDPTPFKKEIAGKKDAPSFDMLRASVILMVSSILISFATSLKLPLSTTYVTFMVAMGASLSDKAWGRESAVYRISGVMVVIGGWFMTAISAFTVSLIVANICYWGKDIAIISLIILAFALIIKSNFFPSKKEATAETDTDESPVDAITKASGAAIFDRCNVVLVELLKDTSSYYSKTISGLVDEKRKRLKKVKKELNAFNGNIKDLKDNSFTIISKLNEEQMDTGHYYVQVLDYTREVAHAVTFLHKPILEYVENQHPPLMHSQIKDLEKLEKATTDFISDAVHIIKKDKYNELDDIIDKQQTILDTITEINKKQIKLIHKEEISTRTSMLYMNILHETKNLLLYIVNVTKAARDFNTQKKI